MSEYDDYWEKSDSEYLATKRIDNRLQKQDEEDWSTGRWLGAVGTAAWQGARDGLLLDTPETFYRAARTIGDIFGSDDLQHWAGEGINDIKRSREEDPFYQVDADVMDDYVARSIYGGLSSVITSAASGAAGAAVGALTGGMGYIPMLAGYAFSHGGIFGLAEYDNYIDDAYTAFKQVNPKLTWQQVQDEVNSSAVISALAEAGLEAGGDLLMGKLLGNAGKAVVGSMGEQQAWRTAAAKTLKGILVTGPLSEMPPELATTAIQTSLRNQDGITKQSVAEAIKETFGSTYVSSMLFGAGGAVSEHGINAGKRQQEQAESDVSQQTAAEERARRAEQYKNNSVIKSLVESDDPEKFFVSLKDKILERLSEQGVTDEQSYRELISKESSQIKPPVNLDPESTEFRESLNTTFADIGFIPVPKIGQESKFKGEPISTVDEFYKIVADFRGECEKDSNYNPEFKRWRIGKIRPEQARVLKDVTGFDFESGVVSFDTDFLKKMYKRHPEVTPELFTMLPYTIANFTDIEGAYKSRSRGEDIVATISVFDGKRYRAVEVVPGKFKQMYLKSFHYRKATQAEINEHDNKNPPSRDGGKLGGSMQTGDGSLDPTSENAPSPYTNNTTDSTLVNNIMQYGDKFVRYLRGEKQELTASEADFFERIKQDMQKDMESARKLGVVDKTALSRFNDLLGINGEQIFMSAEEHKAAVAEQWDLYTGKKEFDLENYDSVNSSLLVPEMNNAEFRNERIHALGEHLTQVKEKDKHTTERLMQAGVQAVRNGVATPESLKRYHAAFANADTAIMAIGMLHEQMNQETTLAMMEAGKTGRKEDQAYAALKMEAANEMTEVLSGMGTTAGRALRAIRTIKEKSGEDLDNALKAVLGKKADEVNADMITRIISNMVKLAKPKKGGFTTKIQQLQEKVQRILEDKSKTGLSDEDMVLIRDLFANTDFLSLSAQIKQRTRYQRGRDIVIESTIAGMLTGTTTHIVNTISGLGTIASEIHDRLFSGMIYGKGSVINGKAEAKAMLHGLTGFVDAIYAAKTAFWTGHSRFGDNSEKAGQMNRGWSKENLYLLAHGIKDEMSREEIEAIGGMGGLSKIVYDSFDLVGKANRAISTNIMIGSDEFLRTLAYNMQRRALAFREMEKAKKSGMGEEKAQEIYNNIMDDQKCPQELHDELVEYTRYLTFQDPINPESGWKNIENIRHKHPELMLVMPFLRTPLNIAKWVGTRTPLIANMFSEYREAMSNNGDMRTKQLTEARMLTGSLLWHTALMLAGSGLLTGSGPSDEDEKEMLYATGWRPNSLHINGKYYELGRLDPVATFLSTMASFVEIASDLDHADLSEVAAATMGSALKVAGDKYYLSGLSDFLMVFRDGERYGAPFLTKLAANIVPFSGARRTVTKGIDPVMREARDLVHMIAKDTPLASMAAAARRTPLGEAVKYHGGSLSRMFSPVHTGEDAGDPVYDEMYRLSDNQALNIGKPQRWFRSKDKSLKLDSHQYSRYLELSGVGVKIGGMNAKERLQRLIALPQYRMLGDEQKGILVGKVIRSYRKYAKKKLIQEDERVAAFYGQGRKETQAEKLLALTQKE